MTDLKETVAKLEQRLQASLAERDEVVQQQAATNAVLQVINASSGDLAPVFDAILKQAMLLCEAEFGILATCEGGQIRTVATRGVPPAFADFRKNNPPEYGPGTGPARILAGERVVHIVDLKSGDAYQTGDPNRRAVVDLGGARTVLLVPLLKSNSVLGYITIYRKVVRPYSDRQITLLQNFADQAVVPLQNARLFEEVQTKSRDLEEALVYQTGSAEILKVIASSPTDVGPVLQAIADSACELCAAADSVVLLKEGDYLRFSAHHGSIPIASETRSINRDWVNGRAVIDKMTIHVKDFFSTEGDEFPEGREMAIRHMGRTVLSVPLLRNNEAIGTIALCRVEANPFSEKQIALLQSFADQAVIAIENARLFNETEETLERQTATADILKVIASSPSDVQPVFEAIVGSANRLLGGFSSTVFRFVEGMAHLEAFTPTTPEADEVLRSSFPVPVNAFAPFRMMQSGEVVQVSDTEEPSYELKGIARARGYRSMIWTPLINKRESIGFIAVTRVQPGSFVDHHVQLLQTFADQAVIAIENARLFNETKEALKRQTATADILKVIASSPSDVQPVLKAIVESACELCEAYDAVIILKEGEELQLSAHHGPIPMNLQRWANNRSSVSGHAMTDGRPVHVHDVLADESVEFDMAHGMSRVDGCRTLLAAPLLREGEAIGALLLRRTAVHPFTDKQIALLQTFADQAVIAIENVRLFDEVQAKTLDLSEALTHQTGSANILRVIASSPTDVGPVLKAIVESACELCEAYDAVLRLKRGDNLELGAHHGTVPADWNLSRINQYWTAGRAALEGRPVHVHDMSSSEGDEFPEAQARARSQGHRTILSVPLLRDDESIGTITLRRLEVNPFTEKQISLLQTFADEAVIAIGNVRLFEEVQARTRELTEALEQQTATSEVLEVISASTGELDSVFQKMLENATRVCGANFGTMSTYEGGSYQNVALYNIPDAYTEQLLAPIRPHPKSGLAIVARTRRAVQIEDLRTQPPYLEGHPAVVALSDGAGARTLVIVPMLRENELIGTIAIYRQEVRPFSEKQVELVGNFAKQAVIAIENTRLLRELRASTEDLRESLQQQTATSEVLEAISSSTGELGPVFQKMLENATRVCGAQFGTMTLYEDEGFRTVALYNAPQAYLNSQLYKLIRPHPESGLSTVEKTRQPVHIDDIRTEAPYIAGHPNVRALADLAGARTLVIVPMLKEGELIGSITIFRQEVRAFTDKQTELVANFANQAVIAIENARLLNELRERTTELTQSLEELRTAQDRLIQTEKLASLGQLTAGIAHEIKNPLNFVNNFAALSAELTDELKDVLAPASLADKIRAEVDELTRLLKDNLQKVVQHGRRADSIVKNMLLHSREGSGEHRRVDLNALVEESLNLAYHGARAEKPTFNVTLSRDFDPEAGTIELFPQEITRVLLNLISNGFYALSKRAAEAGAGFEPELTARTRGNSQHVEIRIRDNGIGIPPEIQKKMFNPFFTTKPAGEGTGLGLSMSHDIIVKQHGGTIHVDIEPGAFTEFVITLPRATSVQKTAGSA